MASGGANARPRLRRPARPLLRPADASHTGNTDRGPARAVVGAARCNDKLRRSDRGHGTAEGGRRRDERAGRQRRRERGLQRDRLHGPVRSQCAAGARGHARRLGRRRRRQPAIRGRDLRPPKTASRSAAPCRGPRAGLAGGSVATVQFQAVTTGRRRCDHRRGGQGLEQRSMVPAVSASNLQVTADSVPPPQPAAGREKRAGIVSRPPGPPRTATDRESPSADGPRAPTRCSLRSGRRQTAPLQAPNLMAYPPSRVRSGWR